MKKNLLLVLSVLVFGVLIVSSAKKILSFNSTAQRVDDEEMRLEQLKVENETLKRELEYKQSQRFAEEEIRNKLGFAKEGEEVFVVPRDQQVSQDKVNTVEIPNWKKWQVLLFGEG